MDVILFAKAKESGRVGALIDVSNQTSVKKY